MTRLLLPLAVAVVVLMLAPPVGACRQHHPHHSRRFRVVHLARRFLGVPYVWGGTSPRGFDCSGFVRYVFARVGVRLPRTTWQQIRAGRRVSTLRVGDILFFHDGHHEGLYLGHGRFIHAPHTGDVVRVRTLASYGPVYEARRVLR